MNSLAGYSASSSGNAQYFCENKYYRGLISRMVALEDQVYSLSRVFQNFSPIIFLYLGEKCG